MRIVTLYELDEQLGEKENSISLLVEGTAQAVGDPTCPDQLFGEEGERYRVGGK